MRAAELLTLLLDGYGEYLTPGQHVALRCRRGPEARLSLLLGQLAALDMLRLLAPAWVREATVICEVWAATHAPADQRAA